MTDGFVWVHRSIFDHPIFAPEPFTEREAFLWMICEAAWKTRRRRLHNSTITLQRGQLAHSTRFMASAWNWSESRVRRFLKRLKIDAMINTATDAHKTLVTICNYNKYQSVGQTADAANDAPSDAVATHSRRKREPRNQGTKEVVLRTTQPDAFPDQLRTAAKTTVREDGPDWHGSPEEQFYAGLPAWEKAGVPRGMLFQIGEHLGGDFGQLIDIATRAAGARDQKAYLGGILRQHRTPTPKANPRLPEWITDARAQGYPVEREGAYWRFAGGLYDDTKQQVGN